MLTAAIDHLATGADGRFQAVGCLQRRRAPRPATRLSGTDCGGAGGAHSDLCRHSGADARLKRRPTPKASRRRPTASPSMPEPEAADPLTPSSRPRAGRLALSYRSALQDGAHQVSVSLGNVRDTATFELILTPPELRIDAPASPVRRAAALSTRRCRCCNLRHCP